MIMIRLLRIGLLQVCCMLPLFCADIFLKRHDPQLYPSFCPNMLFTSVQPAGKKMFEPEGTVSHQILRRLSRNSGSIRAPSISYDTAYEVGETTVCHHWRKRTSECTTYEEMVHNLRLLDAHFDKAVRFLAMMLFDTISVMEVLIDLTYHMILTSKTKGNLVRHQHRKSQVQCQ